MIRSVVFSLAVCFAASTLATDITAVVRAAGAATVTRISGTPYDAAGSYDVQALFDGSQGAGSAQRWLEKHEPTADSPIVIQYSIDEDFWPSGIASAVIVRSFTLFNAYSATEAKKRAPTVFSLSASRDGETWTVLYAVDGNHPVTDWAANSSDTTAPKSHTFEIPAGSHGDYRHYRFTVTANNGGSWTSASELVLEGDIVPYVPAGGVTSVFADSVFWFRGATDRNSDGILQDGEFSNALRLRVADDGSHGCQVAGAPVAISTETVKEPFRAATSERRVLALRPPTEMTDGQITGIQGGYVEVAGCSLPITNVGPFSAVFRLSVDDMQGQDYKYIASFGYNYDKKHGMLFMVEPGDAGKELLPVLVFGGGNNISFRQAFSMARYSLMTNKWADVAITIGDGVATLYTCSADGLVMAESKSIPQGLGTGTEDYSLRLGGMAATDGFSDNMNALRSMNGRFAQVAVWGRCLSLGEVREAFGVPNPDLWKLGVPNGVSAEFAGGTSASAVVGGVDECASMPPCLTEDNPSVSLTFNVSSRNAGLAQVLRINTASRTEEGRVSVSLNGTPLGEADYGPSGIVSLFVRKNLIVSGANTLALTRLSGGDLDIDAVALGGSFRIGEQDDAVWSEFNRRDFAGISDAFDTRGGNVKEVPQEIFPAGYKDSNGNATFSNVTFRIHVDPAIAAMRCRHRFTARLRQVNLAAPLPVHLTLDGDTVFQTDLRRNVFTDCPFMVRDLAAGEHLISCINGHQVAANASFLADCYTIEVLPPPVGSVVTVR